MSSLSPRGSISGTAPAAVDVSEDFADALRDLTDNNRYAISNLTMIAKEHNEHAQVISKTLDTHIKTVRFHHPADCGCCCEASHASRLICHSYCRL
jgi:fructose-1,6-bisphosphatase/sedoheptulose 1,7-bisphosphatase-like protein